MTAYMTNCSVEIGGFSDLAYLGEFHWFLEWIFALKAALMVLKDIENSYTVAPGSPEKLPVAPEKLYSYSCPFRPLFFLTLQLS